MGKRKKYYGKVKSPLFAKYIPEAIAYNGDGASVHDIREWFLDNRPRWTPSVQELTGTLAKGPYHKVWQVKRGAHAVSIWACDD